MRRLLAAVVVGLIGLGVPAAASVPTTVRVSVSSTGGQGNAPPLLAGVSDTGRYVLMTSKASTLVPHDTNRCRDVFLRDVQTSTTVRVDVSSAGAQANASSQGVAGNAVSPDGRFVVFTSSASNLIRGDTNGQSDVFVRDLKLGLTRRVSIQPRGGQFHGWTLGAAVSADGRFVLFSAGGRGRMARAYLRDRKRSVTVRLARRIVGVDVFAAAMSANGRMIAYTVASSGASTVLVHDRATGRTIDLLRQPGGGAFDDLFDPVSFTPTGDKAVFTGSLSGGPTRIGIWQRGGSISTLTDPAFSLESPTITDDGNEVAFVSLSPSFVAGDTNQAADLFVRDLRIHTTLRVDLTHTGAQLTRGVNGRSLQPTAAISGDGRFAAFSSTSTHVVPGDTNNITDLFERGPLS